MKSTFLKSLINHQPVILCISLALLFIPFNLDAQIVGGRGNGQSMPKEVKAAAVNTGGFSGDVSLFSGTYNSSYSLGTVSTPTGLSYSVNLSYSSSFGIGDNLPHTSGIPYGEGWNVDLPSISVSMEDYHKFTQSQLGNLNNSNLGGDCATSNSTCYTPTYTSDEAQKEGDLYWYSPTLNIPGVASGRMVFKYMKKGSIPIFVLHQFGRYIEAEFDGGLWKVILDDGTKYYFEVIHVAHRNASNQRTSIAENNPSALANLVLPKTEVTTWYISRIVHPYNTDGIMFEYYTFGEFDYFQELKQSETQLFGIDGYLNGHGVTITDTLIGGSVYNYGGQFRLGKAYKEIYLKEVNSGYDKLVFKHESIDVSDGHQMMGLNNTDVFRKDSLYSYQTVKEWDSNFNNSWKRYYHYKSDAVTNGGTLTTNMENRNPYVGSVNGITGNTSTGNHVYYLRDNVTTSNEAAFNHGYLESPRIQFMDNSSLQLPPGDVYELRTEIYHPEAQDLAKGFLNIDINITTGDNTINNGNELNSLGTWEGKETIGKGDYNSNRGESIFTTFNQAIKWNTKGAILNTLQTSNFFMLPNLPTEYGGFHIQVGAANADQNFNTEEVDLINGNALEMCPTYYDNLFDGTTSNSNPLRSGDPIPMNFGIGYPWKMMRNFYGEMEQSINDCESFAVSTSGHYGKWWRFNNGTTSNFQNIPTLADNTVKLRKVELVRYTKNPYMLKNIEYYKASDENTDSTDTEGFGWTLIAQQQFTYEIEQVGRYVVVEEANNPGTYQSRNINNNRNLVLLKSIQQLPGILPQNFVIATTPTTHFDYDTEYLIDNYGQGQVMNGGTTTDFIVNSNCLLLTSVTNQLGSQTIIEYGDNYATERFRPRIGAIYSSNSNKVWKRSRSYAAQIYVTVDNKKVIDKTLDDNTSSVIQYDYEFTSLQDYESGLHLDEHFRHDYQFNIKRGYEEAKVYQPELEESATTNRPYIIYKHHTLDNSLAPNAPKDLYWGKVYKVENYDGDGNLITETETFYDYTLAYEQGLTRDKTVGASIKAYDYYDYLNSNSGNIQIGVLNVQDKTELRNLGGGFEGAKFYDAHFQDKIAALTNNYYMTYFHSYFVKKVSEENKVYDEICNTNGSTQYQDIATTSIDYEYYEADYQGITSNESLVEIAAGNIIDNTDGTYNILMEPSWQLYKKTTTSPQYPDAYSEEKMYYYYDLVQDFDYVNDYTDFLIESNFTALKTFYKKRIRNAPFETRTTVKNPNQAPITQATYFEYQGDWDYFADYTTTNDTVYSPNYPCSLPSGTGNDDGIPAGCIKIKFLHAPLGYCLEPSIAPYGSVFCPCDDLPTMDEGNFLMDVELNNPNKVYLKSVYTQVLEQTNQPIATFVNNTDSGRFDMDFGTIEVLKVEEILKRNRLGLVHQVEDVNGIITQYNYVPIHHKHYYYCHPTRPNFDVYSRRILSVNNGMIASVTVGQGRTDALTTNYTYNQDNTIATITDANNGILSYTYDEYGRMRTASHNGSLLSEVDYHQWENQFGESFEERTMENYVQTTTHNDLSGTNYTRARAYLDPLGRTTLTAAYASNDANRLIVSGYVEHDSWNRQFKAYKPFIADNTNFGNLTFNTTKNYANTNSNLTGNYSFTEQLFEDNPRSRVLKSAKFGEDLHDASNTHLVKNDYCVIDGATMATELNLTTAEQEAITPLTASDGSTIPASDYIILKTTITDEDGKWATDYTNTIGKKLATLRNDNINDIITLYVYDRKGNLTKVINPEKQETDYKYNYLGQLYEEKTVDGGKKQFIYNRRGQIVFEQDAQGAANDYCRGYLYDDYGRLLKQAKVDIVNTGYTNPFFNLDAIPNQYSLLFLNSNEQILSTLVNQSIIATLEKQWIYEDNVNLADSTFIENARFYLQNSLTNIKGQVTQTVSYDLFGEPIEYRFFSYNNRGQLKWEITQFNNNGISETGKGLMTRIDYPKYNLRGSLQTMNVDLDGDRDLDLQYHYTYDQWNRLNEVYLSYDGQEHNGTKIAQYYYDDALGHITKVEYYDEEGNCTKKVDEIEYTYDIRDRLKLINGRLFLWKLYYDNDHVNFNVNKVQNAWNGNIKASKGVYKFGNNSHTITNVASLTNFTGQDQSAYTYNYDGVNRLIKANAKHTGIVINGNLNLFGDVVYTYDKIGNLTTLTRKDINNNNVLVSKKYEYNYSQGTNRLMNISIPTQLVGMPASSLIDRTYTYDDNGNLKSDSKRGLVNTVYGRANLPWTINMSGAKDVEYLYDINDSRTFKTEVSNTNVVTISEYYLKSSSGQDIGVYNFNSDKLTWYVFGKERIAKFEHQYSNALNKVTNDALSIPQAGMNQRLIDALEPLYHYNDVIQEGGFTLPNTLLLIRLENNVLMYILQTHLDLIEGNYTIEKSYPITAATNQFAFTMSDGTIGYFSLQEIFDMLGTVANGLILNTWNDPFDIPLTTPQTVHEPDFHYYLYDHLGNTRIVYSTTIPSCGNVEYTLEAVMDYFPYGKTLREFIKTPEKYVTTGHERDVETGLDYRGARFYDSDVCRFLSLDPLAAEFPEWSDYNYVLGNPVMFIDPDGKAPNDPIFDIKTGEFLGHYNDSDYDGEIMLMDANVHNALTAGQGEGVVLSPYVAEKNGDYLKDIFEGKEMPDYSDLKLLSNVYTNLLVQASEEGLIEFDRTILRDERIAVAGAEHYTYPKGYYYNSSIANTGNKLTGGKFEVSMNIQYYKDRQYVGPNLGILSHAGNAISVLGVHEYGLHGIANLQGNASHPIIYPLQWDATKDFIGGEYKKTLMQRAIVGKRSKMYKDYIKNKSKK